MKTTTIVPAALLLVGLAAPTQPVRAQTAPPRDTRPDTWVAVDALGRAVPLQGGRIAGAPDAGQVPARRPEKFV